LNKLTEIKNLLLIEIFFDENRLHLSVDEQKKTEGTLPIYFNDESFLNDGRREKKRKCDGAAAARVLRLVDEMTHSYSLYTREHFLYSFVERKNTMFTSKKALLLLANGSEESEVVITLDVNKQNQLNQKFEMIYLSSIFGNRFFVVRELKSQLVQSMVTVNH